MSYLAALLSGLLLPLAFSPVDLHFAAIPSLALLFFLWTQATPRAGVLQGYLFGLGQFGAGVSWVFVSMHQYGGANIVESAALTALFVAILSLYPALVGFLAARLQAGGNTFSLVLAFPSLWILGEWFRGWFLTGFPWLQIGYTQLDSPLGGFVPVLGIYGSGWLLALTSALLVAAISNTGRIRWIMAGTILSVWMGGAASRGIQWSTPAGAPFKATLIQGNIPQNLKWAQQTRWETLDLYAQITREHLDSKLVVWPETAIPAWYDEVKDTYLASLKMQLKTHGTDLLTGIPLMTSETKQFYNALVSLGEPDRIYLKRHLVPFGEYLPLKPLTGFILDIMQIPASDFSSGGNDQPLLEAAGFPLVSSICYEDIFGDEARAGLPEGAYLVNVTNDAWFGDSFAPHQHLQMARARAIESGRYMLRATNTGMTAVVSSTGELLATAPQFKRTALSAEIVPMQGETPYVRFGDAFIIIPLLLISGSLYLFSYLRQ